MTERLTQTPVSLKAADTSAWQLWAHLAQLAQHLQPTDWVLVGGQMVALHCHIEGITPGRATTDIDIVANVLVNPNALFACRDAAAALDLTTQPSANNRRQHRFRNDNLVLDVMVPDHMPKHLLLRLVGRDPVPIEGGYRALQRAEQCAISTEAGDAIVPVPDLQGALVLKARAFIADSRDRGRHQFDLAQLSAAVDDPMTLAAALDSKERRALRRVDMPLTVTKTHGCASMRRCALTPSRRGRPSPTTPHGTSREREPHLTTSGSVTRMSVGRCTSSTSSCG